MKTVYTIKGMTCEKCVVKVKQVFLVVPKIQSTRVNLETEELEIVSDSPIDISVLNDVVSKIGSYTVVLRQQKNWWRIFVKKVKKFLPLIIVFMIIISWSSVHQYIAGFNLHRWMSDFMGAFFLIFGGLKVINWRKFAEGYIAYDPLAQKIKLYAYVYPVIEIFLGLAYQFHLTEELPLNFVTVLVLSIATYGIAKKLKEGELVQCACLGGFFNIPISWFTIFENALMIAMAISMQVFFGRI